jgi:endonuclease/exonuclease/phosphatase family metal-dependent hydrolase
LPEDAHVRTAQTRTLIDWLERAPAGDAVVVTGDFNAPPFEPAYGLMEQGGYRSASVEANGAEPAVTWPSGIVAPGMDTHGDPNCIDYVWLGGRAKAVSARLAGNRPSPTDPTLYPSDHFAVVVEVEV